MWRERILIVVFSVVLVAGVLTVVLLFRPRGTEQAAPAQPPPLATAPVLVVKIDNVPEAHPATGLGAADVIYVEPVEGGLTRIAAVFSSHRPETVGPVRSARESDFDLLPQYGRPALAYSGAAPPVVQALHAAPLSARVVNASAEDLPSAYFRDDSRAAPHNLFAHTAALPSSVGTPPGQIFPSGPAPGGGTAGDHTVSFGAASFTFHWTGTAWAIGMNGAPFTSSEAGPLTAATVIEQHVRSHPSTVVDDHGHGPSPVAETVGGGDMTMLRDGLAFTGTWQRATADVPTTYSVPAAAGPVWVLLVPV